MAAIEYDCYELVQWLIREKGMQEEECGTLSKRLVQFADSFCKEFDEKICAYFEEASGTSFKKSEVNEFLIGAFAGALGGAATLAAGAGPSGFKPAQESGQKAYGFLAKKPREKAIKITLKIQELVKETDIQKLFIKIATSVFIIHQQQFMKFIGDEDWLTNVERLVEDAVRIIFSYLEKCEKDEELKFESMALMAFLIHTNKNKTGSKMDLMYEKSKGAIKKVGRESKRLIKWEKKHWTFEKFDEEKCGFVAKINEEVKYFWTPTPTANLSPPKYGFKLIPPAILHLIDEKEKLQLQEYKPEEYYYNYLLIIESEDELDEIVDLIKEIIANCATGINKDMHREMIGLRRDLKALGITKKNEGGEEDSKQKEKRNEVKSEEILAPVASFIGRENELEAIHEKLNSDEESQGRIAHAVCICGLGGMGKTELARKYIEIHRQEFYKKVYWINADNITYDEQAIKDFYEKHINSSKGKILMVLDNAHKFEDVVPFFPKTRMNNVFFLITSRSKNWDAQQEGEIHLVQLTTFEEARELIENKLPVEKEEDVNKLIAIVGNLPLALQQAISFITNKQKKQRALRGKSDYKIQDYVKEFKKNSKAFLDVKFDKVRYLQTVYTTWNITFQQIEQDEEHGKQAIEIMRIIAYLDPIFEVSYLTEVNGFDEDAVYLLNRYSLINLKSSMFGGRWASVHRLLQEVIRKQMQETSSSIADCNNLEETILSQVIELKYIFDRANEVFWERLQDEKYAHILKKYCQQIDFEKTPLGYFFLNEKVKIFETMWTQKYLSWQEDNVKEAVRKNIQFILRYCDVNIACEILNELENENPLLELRYSKSHSESEKEEMKQETFKLIALLRNEDEESKEALLEHLSQIEDANLIKEILEMSDYYVRKLKFPFQNDLLELAILKDHPGILSNYLLKHLKQDGTRHLQYAIDCENENAFCELANKEFIEEIYNKNILINDVGGKALNILDYVYTRGTLKMVKHLENVGFTNSNDLTFYLSLYKHCRFEVFKYAFCNGTINAERKDSSGRSVLFYAARARRVDLFEFLIRSSEKSLTIDLENEEDIKGNSLLHYAFSQCGMDNGQDDVDEDYIFSETWDFLYADLSSIKVLLNAGADPSKANVYGQTAFMLAAYWHDKEVIECLLSATDSAAVSLINNQRCCDGRTALHYAAMRGNCKQISNIISTLNTQSSTISPLRFEQQPFYLGNTIDILLEIGADAKQEDNFGRLPLHYASMIFGSLTECELLGFELKEWPSLKDHQGNTPFHYAAIARNTRLLIELRKIEDESNGESLNLKNVVNKQNQHLLHSLANCETNNPILLYLPRDYDDYKNVLDWLIFKKGLDLSAKDIFGHTPMDYVRKRNNQAFIEAIKEINRFKQCFKISSQIFQSTT